MQLEQNLASTLSQRWKRFAAVVVIMLTLLSFLVGPSIWREWTAKQERRERSTRAEALFQERCKQAGIVINRTVQSVNGIELTRIRPSLPSGGPQYFDPMWSEAAMANEYRGDDYINQFLLTEFLDARNPDRRGSLNAPDFKPSSGGIKRGYRYVEVLDSSTNQRYRAQLGLHAPGTNLWGKAPSLVPVSASTTRYALDYEDLVDAADRELWIAGTRLKVVDKESGEVIAHLTRYVWDSSFGARSTGRWPWQHAASTECPRVLGAVHSVSRMFIDTVVYPSQGD